MALNNNTFLIIACLCTTVLALHASGSALADANAEATVAVPSQVVIRDIEIPSGPLAQALIIFSLQFNSIIVAKPELIEGHRSHPVKGFFSAKEALALLLQDTSLLIEGIAGGGFIIKAPQVASTQAQQTEKKDNRAPIEETLILSKDTSSRSYDPTISRLQLDQEFLHVHNVDSITRLADYAPSVQAASKDEGIFQFNIRGIENYGISYQTTSIAPMYLDNRYISEVESSTAILFDIDRVDLLYGPQVTSPGRGAIGGGIYISSAKPQFDNQQSFISVTAGDYNLRRIEGAAGVILNDYVALRLASLTETRSGYTAHREDYGNYKQQDFIPTLGFYENNDNIVFADGNVSDDRQDDSDKLAVRLSLLALPSQNSTLFYSWEKNLNRSNPKGYIDPFIVNRGQRAVVVDSDIDREGESETSNLAFTYQYNDLNASYRYTHVKYNYFETQDLDLSRFPGMEEFNINQHDELSQTHLVELAHSPEQSRLQWLLGLHYARDTLQRKAQFNTLIDSQNDFTYESSTLFFDPQIDNDYHDIYSKLQYKPSEDWLVSLGTRYSHNSREMKNSALIGCSAIVTDATNTALFTTSRSLDELRDAFQRDDLPCQVINMNREESGWRELTYSMGASYRINTQTTVTLNHSTGFRPGIVGTGFRPEFIEENYAGEPHTSKNYELALSYKSADHKYYGNAMLFFNKHENIAINNPYSSLHAETSGIDLTAKLNTDQFGELVLSGSYLKAEVTSYDTIDFVFFDNQAWNPPSQEDRLKDAHFVDLSGNRLPRAPEYVASLNYSYPVYSKLGFWRPAIHLRYSYKYYLDIYNRTDFLLDLTKLEEPILHRNISVQDAFTTADLTLHWKSQQEKYYALLGIFNMSDKQIRTGFRQSFISTEGFPSTYAAPRTIRLKLGIHF